MLSKLVPRVLKDETRDAIKETIVDSKEFLHTTEGVENKSELILIKSTAGGTCTTF